VKNPSILFQTKECSWYSVLEWMVWNWCGSRHRRSQCEARGGNSPSSCNCVLVSSVKFSLNTAPKCPILSSNNKKIYGEGSSLPRQISPPATRGTTHPARTWPLSAPWAPWLTRLRRLTCPLFLLLKRSLATSLVVAYTVRFIVTFYCCFSSLHEF